MPMNRNVQSNRACDDWTVTFLQSVLLLALVIVSGIFLTSQSQTRLNGNAKQAHTKSGEKIFFKQADQCLAIIEQAAQKISIKGVAMIAFIPGNATESWISKMKVVGHLTSDKANLLGIACTKAAEMADTYKDSGSGVREIYSGELGYKGGLIKKVDSGYILAIFSGGSGEQDVEVSRIGLEWLSKYY
jgi:hypothetical protein